MKAALPGIMRRYPLVAHKSRGDGEAKMCKQSKAYKQLIQSCCRTTEKLGNTASIRAQLGKETSLGGRTTLMPWVCEALPP